MHKRLVVGLVAGFMCAVPATASAVPGDPGISNPTPGAFRLNDNTLEPGCFVPGRNAPIDVDSHLVIGVDGLSEEAHVTVSDGASFSVDQVLVPSPTDGYNVINTFDTGTVNNDPDIDPGQTATLLHSPTRFVDQNDVIVCLSGHGDAVQNQPYTQETGGLVSAKNRPILQPTVVALGESAIDPLNTFKLGFGYTTEKWYQRPAFETLEDGNGLFPAVTDPNAFFSPTFGNNLPGFVGLLPRPADFPYDARRVNDVDAAGEAFFFPTPAHGQNFLFRQAGDSTAWIDDGGVPGPGQSLLTVLTRGDFPITWTLRPSLAAPSSERSVTFSSAQFDAWEQGWQDYYCGKGPHPTLPLAPGSNSPDPRDCPIVINLPEAVAPPTPANPTPPQVAVPVTNVNNTTNNTTAGEKVLCNTKRKITFRWTKDARSGFVTVQGRRFNAHKVHGRLQATAVLKPNVAVAKGAYVKVIQHTTLKSGKHRLIPRTFKVC